MSDEKAEESGTVEKGEGCKNSGFHAKSLILAARQHGFRINEITRPLPTNIMNQLREFFVGEEHKKEQGGQNKGKKRAFLVRHEVRKAARNRQQRRAELPKGNIKRARARRIVAQRPRVAGRRPITDTLTLEKRKAMKKKDKQAEEQKKPEEKIKKQFRIFGIGIGRSD